MKKKYTEEFIEQVLKMAETMPVIKVAVLHNIRDVMIYKWMKQRSITPPCIRSGTRRRKGEVVR
jgi:transposase-like protein